MTMGYRLFSFLSLLPQINFYSRPYLQVIDPSRKDLSIHTIPFALFEDLKEAAYLMEYADGVRPYVLMWYHQVFLPTYNGKEKADSRTNSKGQDFVEKIIAVTTEQLAKATEVKQNKIMSKTQIRENYIEPLINQGYIDKTDSEIDKRTDIYYPVILKIEKLNGTGNPSNFSQGNKIGVTDSTIFPDKSYIKASIQTTINYTIPKGLRAKIVSSDKQNITLEDLVDRYYNNPEEYFENVYPSDTGNQDISHENSEVDTNSIKSDTEPSKKLNGMADPSSLSNFINSSTMI